jgi:ATP-binding cassette, subfamily B, multidrug efflux pump
MRYRSLAMSNGNEEAALAKSYDGRLMRRLLAYVVPHKGLAALALGLLLLSSTLQLAGPLITAAALDLFIKPAVGAAELGGEPTFASRWLGEQLAARGLEIAPADGVLYLAFAFGINLVLVFCALFAQGYVMQLMGQRVMSDLRRDVFHHLQRLPVGFFDRQPIGRLVTRATTDVEALNELFTAGLVAVFGDLFLLFGIVTVLFLLNWHLALWSLAILPLLLLLTLWFKTRARQSFREVRVKIARINAFLQEHVGGMGVVQLFGREPLARQEFGQINRDHRDANVRGIFYYAVYYPGVELITAFGLALILGWGGREVLGGALSIGALVAFLQYTQRFYQPLADLSERYNVLQQAMASSERIFELLDTPALIESPAAAYTPDQVRGDLELEHVRFSYKEGTPVLEDLSFKVRAGETVAVVGHTGAGKSTLANLLLRFYDVGAGTVKVDGVDVRQWDLGRLRRSIGMVLQDVFLFAGDVAANIRLGEEKIDEARLRWAAGEVGALPFIEALPSGFATPVKERGAGLSVGQKQLIAFARALAFDPEILILDEATASIDSETEAKIQLALERLLEGRTSLVIAHRLSTIKKADRILVMHKGRLREQGTHQELLAQRGIYHRLYQLQFQTEDAAAA